MRKAQELPRKRTQHMTVTADNLRTEPVVRKLEEFGQSAALLFETFEYIIMLMQLYSSVL